MTLSAEPIVAEPISAEPSMMSAQPSSGANHPWSPTASCGSTPAKRGPISISINELIEAEELTPKESATKTKSGRKIKHIKKE